MGSPSVVADLGAIIFRAGPVLVGGGVEKRLTSMTRAVWLPGVPGLGPFWGTPPPPLP